MEAFGDQGQESWITGHVHAYRYFGGATRILTPDNLKTGVTRHGKGEVILNPTYKRRKETIERVFADAKEKHAMRYTQYRGLTQVTNWVKLKFAAMNLKKLARWLWKENSPSFLSRLFLLLYAGNPAYLYR